MHSEGSLGERFTLSLENWCSPRTGDGDNSTWIVCICDNVLLQDRVPQQYAMVCCRMAVRVIALSISILHCDIW